MAPLAKSSQKMPVSKCFAPSAKKRNAMAESTMGAMMRRVKLASVQPRYFVVRRAVTAERLKSRVQSRAASMAANG